MVFEVVLPCCSSKVVRLSGVGLQVGGRAATEEKRRGDEDGRQRRTGPRLPDGKILSLKERKKRKFAAYRSGAIVLQALRAEH